MDQQDEFEDVVSRRIRWWSRLGGICVVAVLFLVVLLDPGNASERLLQWMQNEPGLLAALVFMFVYVVGTVVFVPSPVLAVSAGMVFGLGWGAVLALLGRPLGALVAFLLGRYVAREKLREWVARSKRFERLDETVEQNPFRVVTTLRLVPVVPFNALNYMLGLTSICWKKYTLSTSLGIIPVTLIYVFAGDTAAEVSLGAQGEGTGLEGGLGWLALALVLVALVWLARSFVQGREPRAIEV